jgi:signal transduction histidine kinase
LPPGISLEADLPDLCTVINANATLIHQLLTALITNASEAMENAPGVIHLILTTTYAVNIQTTHRFPVDWQLNDQPYTCLSVTDSGVGIDPENIEKLFDPFFATKFTGRGLGLAVVLGILRSHSGTVTVESQPGRGSTFRLFFPLITRAVTPEPQPSDQRDPL